MSETSRSGGAFDVTHTMVLGIALPMTFGFLTVPLLGITDTAVAGRLGDPDLLAGLAVGAILFDLVFSSFNFLRASTTALTAQAWGRGDDVEQERVFWRAFAIALGLGLLILILSPLILSLGLLAMGPEQGVAEATTHWFAWRILSGPATLGNFAILGFLLGRGRSRAGLLLQVLINGTNIVLCIILGLWLKGGISGIALATVIGETVGLVVGLMVAISGFAHRNPLVLAGLWDRDKMLRLFSLNTDIMIRSFVLLGAFFLMTRVGTALGSLILAANAVLMNIFMVAGFWLDGLANAAETIVGRAIGAGFAPAFHKGVKLSGLWSLILAGATSLFFLVFGHAVIDFLTNVEAVRVAAYAQLPLAALTALSGFLAFHMDGVFIGATWSHAMRNRMILAFLGFGVALAVLVPPLGNRGLWIALNVFLLLRGLFLLAALPGLSRQMFREAQ